MAEHNQSIYKTEDEREAVNFWKTKGVQRRVEYPAHHRKYVVRLPPTPKADGSVTLNKRVTVTSKHPTTLEAVMYDEQFKCERNHPDGSVYKEENTNFWSQSVPAALPMALMYGQVEEVIVKLNFPSMQLRGGVGKNGASTVTPVANTVRDASPSSTSSYLSHVDEAIVSVEQLEVEHSTSHSTKHLVEAAITAAQVEVERVSPSSSSAPTKQAVEFVLPSTQVEQSSSASAKQVLEAVIPSNDGKRIGRVSTSSPKEDVENSLQSTEVDHIAQVSSPAANQVVGTALSTNELEQVVAYPSTASPKAATIDLVQTKPAEVEGKQVVASSAASTSPRQTTPTTPLAKSITIPLSLDVRNQQWPFNHPNEMDIDDGRKWTVGHIDWIPGGIRKFYDNYPGGYTAFHIAVAATGKGFFSALELKALISPALKLNKSPVTSPQGRSPPLKERDRSVDGIVTNSGASANGVRSPSSVGSTRSTPTKGSEKANTVKSASSSPKPIPPHLRPATSATSTKCTPAKGIDEVDAVKPVSASPKPLPPHLRLTFKVVEVSETSSPKDIPSPASTPPNAVKNTKTNSNASTIGSPSPISSPNNAVKNAQGSPAALNNGTSSASISPKIEVEKTPASPVNCITGGLSSTLTPKTDVDKAQVSPAASAIRSASSICPVVKVVEKAQTSPAVIPVTNGVAPHLRHTYKSVEEMKAALDLEAKARSSMSSLFSQKSVPPHLRHVYKSVDEMKAASATKPVSPPPTTSNLRNTTKVSPPVTPVPSSVPPHLRHVYKSVEEMKCAFSSKIISPASTTSDHRDNVQRSTSASSSPKVAPPHLRNSHVSAENLKINKNTPSAIPTSDKGLGKVGSKPAPSSAKSIPPHLRNTTSENRRINKTTPLVAPVPTMETNNLEYNPAPSLSTMKLPPHLRLTSPLVEDLKAATLNTIPPSVPTQSKEVRKVEVTELASPKALSEQSADHVKVASADIITYHPSTPKETNIAEVTKLASPKPLSTPEHSAKDFKAASANTPSSTPSSTKMIDDNIEIGSVAFASQKQLPPHPRQSQPLGDIINGSISTTRGHKTRPKTTDTVARRLIGAALGMKFAQKTDETSLAVETALRHGRQIKNNADTQVGREKVEQVETVEKAEKAETVETVEKVEEPLHVGDKCPVTPPNKIHARVSSPWTSPHLSKVMTTNGLELLDEQRQLIDMLKRGENFAGEIEIQHNLVYRLEEVVEAEANALGMTTVSPRYGIGGYKIGSRSKILVESPIANSSTC